MANRDLSVRCTYFAGFFWQMMLWWVYYDLSFLFGSHPVCFLSFSIHICRLPPLLWCRPVHLFFIDLHSLSYCVHKIWRLWKSKRGCSSRNSITSSLQGILRYGGCEFFSMSWNALTMEQYQRRPMVLNFSHGRGNNPLFETLSLPLWLQSLSIAQIVFHDWKKNLWKKLDKKLNYEQRTLVQKVSQPWTTSKRWLQERDFPFILFGSRFKG